MTLQEFMQIEARLKAQREKRIGPPAADEACEVEAGLHSEIAQECRRRGWLAFHGRMDKASGRTLGEPDFTILMPDGVVVFLECKTRTGKRSTDQLAVAAVAERLGHSVHVVRSMAEVHAVFNAELRSDKIPKIPLADDTSLA